MSTLAKLTAIENYVRGIYNTLKNSLSNLDIDTKENIEIKVSQGSNYYTVPISPIKSFTPISRLTQNEVKKYASVFPAVNLSFPEANTDLRGAYVLSTTSLSPFYNNGSNGDMTINNLNVAVITAATTFTVTNTGNLTFSSLKYIFGNFNFTPAGTPIFYFPELEFIEGTYVLPATNSFPSLPKLKVGRITTSNTSIQEVILPEVIQLDYTNLAVGNLQKVILPKVKVLILSLTGTKSLLTDINLPSIEWLGSSSSAFSLPTSPILSNFYLGESLKGVNGNVVIAGSSLNQASVDNILIRLAALNGQNGTSYFGSRTVTITGTSSAPSAEGLTAKATLISRGCTVTTN
jgi:hypothetical protein